MKRKRSQILENLFYNDNLKKFMLDETDGLWIKKHKFQQV